jgi:hypothetical protein
MTWTAPLVEQERQALNLRWTQGDAVSFGFRFVGFAAYAGYTWTAHLRCAQSRTATLVATFLVSVAADGEDLVVAIGLPPSQNQQAASTLWWDIQSDNHAGDIRTWLGGMATVVPDVTEDAS